MFRKPKVGIIMLLMILLASCVGIAVRTYLLDQMPTVLYNTPSEK